MRIACIDDACCASHVRPTDLEVHVWICTEILQPGRGAIASRVRGYNNVIATILSVDQRCETAKPGPIAGGTQKQARDTDEPMTKASIAPPVQALMQCRKSTPKTAPDFHGAPLGLKRLWLQLAETVVCAAWHPYVEGVVRARVSLCRAMGAR
jgi:hypothetical protein